MIKTAVAMAIHVTSLFNTFLKFTHPFGLFYDMSKQSSKAFLVGEFKPILTHHPMLMEGESVIWSKVFGYNKSSKTLTKIQHAFRTYYQQGETSNCECTITVSGCF